MNEHPEDRKRLRSIRKWSDPRYALLESSKSSAKTRGLEHNIKRSDIIIPTHCPVLGYLLKPGGRAFDSMSIDRIDSTKGYIPGNICVISWRANRLKSDATLEELRSIVTFMESKRKKND